MLGTILAISRRSFPSGSKWPFRDDTVTLNHWQVWAEIGYNPYTGETRQQGVGSHGSFLPSGKHAKDTKRSNRQIWNTNIYSYLYYIYTHNYNSKGSMKDVFSTSMLIYQRVWPLGYGLYIIYMLWWSLIRNTVSYRNMTSRSNRVTDGDKQDFPWKSDFWSCRKPIGCQNQSLCVDNLGKRE